MTVTTKSAIETKQEAGKIAGKLFPDDNQATILALRGDLGAGKTTFTQGLLDFFNITEPATSPTFVIRKAYEIEYEGFKKLIHYDWYRIEHDEEISKVGFLDDLSEPSNLIVIEWPEKAQAFLSANTFYIDFKFINENTRDISYV